MTHFDTSFLIDYMRESARGTRGPATEFLDNLDDDEELGVSLFVVCELQTGVHSSRRPSEEQEKVDRMLGYLALSLPDERLAKVYGRALAQLTKRRQSISAMDLLIGATAIVAGATLVTRNARDFDRIPDLRVVTY